MGSPIMTDLPKIICTVRALHPFDSPQQSSLSFQKGELIEVFNQLESGWWDGWCHGTRGWFPSNYVEIVPDSKASHTLSTTNPLIKPVPPQNDAAHHIYSEMDDPDNDRVDLVIPSIKRVAPADVDGFSDDGNDDNDDQFEDANDNSQYAASTTQLEPVLTDEALFMLIPVDQIMSQWVERTTPQGRVYYCNLLTQETTWDRNEIDQMTGRLRKANGKMAEDDEPHILDLTIQGDMVSSITWQQLTSDIAVAIRQLNATTHKRQQSAFVEHASLVVRSIRNLLYCTGLLENDSYRTRDSILRRPHQLLMASLTKLVLSANIAANVTPLVHETLSRLQYDADNVLLAVRDFVTVCKEANIVLDIALPRFISDDVMAECSATPSNSEFSIKPADMLQPQQSRYPLNQDLVVSAQTYTNNIRSSIDALFSVSTNDHGQTEHQDHEIYDTGSSHEAMLTIFRQLTLQLQQYTRVIEAMDPGHLASLEPSSVERFNGDKQDLYDAFGQLFGVLQLSDPAELARDSSDLDDALVQMQQVLERVFLSIHHVVYERRVGLVRDNAKSVLGEDPEDALSESEDGSSTVRSMTSLPPSSMSLHERNASIQQAFPLPLASMSNTSRFGGSMRGQPTTQERSSMDALWFLESDYQATEIQLGPTGEVRAGTLRALVERLTLHDQLDTSFISTFLLTYRSFCTPEEFVYHLEDRYHTRPPDGLTPENFELWTEKKQKLIRLRVFSVMKQWLETYYNEEDKVVLGRLEFFITTAIRDSSEFSASQLMRLIEKRRELDADDRLKKLVPNVPVGPTPVVPKPLTQVLTLTDIDTLELARQLSIVDFKLYSSIRPLECLNKAWSKEDSDIATHIKSSIKYCNRLTSWVASSILEHDEIKRRVVMVRFWAQVAERCRGLNNYNTCMAILSGFDNSAVARLRKTWEAVGTRTNQQLNQIRKLMGANRNFTAYREIIRAVNPPCIPFLGIYLQDLTFIEDGNPDYLVKAKNMINFAKRQKTAAVIQEIKQFQSSPYKLHSVNLIQDFINKHLERTYDVDTLYERSLKIEPREVDASPSKPLFQEQAN